MEEIWKGVKNYEGYYEVSNLGRVRSLPRIVRSEYRGFMRNGQIIKHHISRNGYHLVHLYKEGKMKAFLVHRLVYATFVGEIPDGLQVNHIDECKENNVLSNLNLMTAKENTNWGTKIERCRRKAERKVVMDNEKEFDSLTKAARYLGCSEGFVESCCKHPTYTVYGHHFRYK